MNDSNKAIEKERKNPKYMYNQTHTELLGKIAKGEIDPVEWAKYELASRGMNEENKWIGFKEAEVHFGFLPAELLK